ncbi:MAG: hypothetical protein ACJ8J0_28130, partial [Longimicrobiaceae bacterium]
MLSYWTGRFLTIHPQKDLMSPHEPQALASGEAALLNSIVLPQTSVAGPALAGYPSRLYLAWSGTNSNNNLNVISSPDGVKFGNHVTLSDMSALDPALAVNPRCGVALGFTGTDNSLNVIYAADGMSFKGKVTLKEQSYRGPALESFTVPRPGKVSVLGLAVAWVGTWPHRSTQGGTLNVSYSADFSTFGSKVTLGENSFERPALRAFNGRLYLA